MVDYETERILSAVRIALVSSISCGDTCPALQIFDHVYDHVKEQNDAETLVSLGLSDIGKKCSGCAGHGSRLV